MADSDKNIEPEPVDAEFEPALDDAELAALSAERGPGWAAVLVIAVVAILGGGILGAIGSGFVQSGTGNATGTDETSSVLADTITNLETRLAALESEDPAEAVRRAVVGDVAALETRLAALEAVPPGEVDLSDFDQRLNALETAPDQAVNAGSEPRPDPRIDDIEAAQTRQEALINQMLDQASASDDAGIDPQILENLSQRLTALEAVDADQPATTDRGPQIVALTDRLAALETSLSEARQIADTAQTTAESAALSANTPGEDAQAARQLAARALALTALRDRAATGGAYEAERAALARLWRGQEDLAALATYSRSGAPTLDQLQADYPGAAIREAAGPGRVFFGLIEVRQVEPGDGEGGPLAMTALAEARLAENDLVGALTLTERLEGASLEAAQAWILGANARLQTENHINAMRNALAENAAEQGADPS